MRAITILFILLAHLGMAQVINLDPPVNKAVYSDTAKFALDGAGTGSVGNADSLGGQSAAVWDGKINAKLNMVDTLSLSNRINTKLSLSDTANMLTPYLQGVDTVSLSNRINTKQPIGSYLTTELDPVWISDSVDYYTKLSVNSLLSSKQSKSDTTTFDATKTYVNSQGFLKTTVLNANYIGIGSISNTLTGSSNLTYNTTDGMVVNGDINYHPPHGYYYCQNQTLTINVATANQYVRLTNGTNNLFTVGESQNITWANDSATITKNGDYGITLVIVFEGANDRDFFFNVYKNGASMNGSPIIQVGKGAGRQINCSQMFYGKSLVVGDDLKVMVTSEDASDPVIKSATLYIKKEH